MTRVIENVVKCHNCGSYIQYDSDDVEEVEKSFSVGTYNGETYIANVIECPKCGRKLEL